MHAHNLRFSYADLIWLSSEPSLDVVSRSTVDHVISEDIHKCLAIESSGADHVRIARNGRTSVFPPHRSGLVPEKKRAIRPTGNLVPSFDQKNEDTILDAESTRSEDREIVRPCLTLDSRVYTGSAELRGGTVKTTIEKVKSADLASFASGPQNETVAESHSVVPY